jgi:hypothetical protein
VELKNKISLPAKKENSSIPLEGCVSKIMHFLYVKDLITPSD